MKFTISDIMQYGSLYDKQKLTRPDLQVTYCFYTLDMKPVVFHLKLAAVFLYKTIVTL
jgi:hypothetical protein